MASIRETWHDCGTALQRLIVASLALGAAIFIVGISGDYFQWWKKLEINFIPNAMTTLSGFFVGAPVALVFLGTLEALREERKLKNLSDSAWRDFADRVNKFCAEDRIEALRVNCQTIGDKWKEINSQLHFPLALAIKTTQEEVTAHYAGLQPTLEAWATELETELHTLAQLMPRPDELDLEWASLQASWTMLETYVKIQRFQMQAQPLWLPSGTDSRIRQKILVEQNPLRALSSQTHSRMPNMPGYLTQWAALDPSQFGGSVLMDRNSDFYRTPTADYSQMAWSASDALEQLKGDVRSAETPDGWPPLSE